MRHKPLVLLTVVMVALSLSLLQGGASTAQNDTTFDSPLITPPAPPAPTPPSSSAEVQKALQYISEREGIPLEGLLVVNDYERAYPLTGRTFRAIAIMDDRTHEGQEYYVLVDLISGRIEEDWETVEAAEEAAYRARYGKLHPSLYERLGQVGDDDRLPVAVWLAPNPNIRTREQVYAELAVRYPEAALSMEREEMPWAVDDPVLAKEIQGEYRRMRAEDTAARAGPLVNHLGEGDFAVKTYGAMPSISAFLPKKVILELSGRDDTGVIYLIAELVPDEWASPDHSDNPEPDTKNQTFKSSALVSVAVIWGLALLLIYLLWRADKPGGKRLLGAVLAAAMALTLLWLHLAPHQPQEIELPFETIERRSIARTGGLWDAREPGLMVIAASEDLIRIDDLFTEGAQAQLGELDFGNYFAVAIFLGWRGTGHEGVTLERVIRRGNVISLYTQVGRPLDGEIVTSPHHLVKVRKEGSWNRMIHFTLYMDGTETTSLSHFVP